MCSCMWVYREACTTGVFINWCIVLILSVVSNICLFYVIWEQILLLFEKHFSTILDKMKHWQEFILVVC